MDMQVVQCSLPEKDFTEHIVETNELEVGGQVGVHAILTEIFMMFEMVTLRSIY